MDSKIIYTASRFYKEKFSSKVYKISLDAGCTCPNRDGTKGIGGCIFCSENGSGDFASSRKQSIKEQVEEAKNLLSSKLKKSKEVKYIAYFQNFTSTYGNPEQLILKYQQAIECDDIVGISVGTRPDCINEQILVYLAELAKRKFVSIELGLQTSNEKTGELINRCYSNEDFCQAVKKIKSYSKNIHIVSHIIFGLPFETENDMMNTVRFCVDSGVDGVKFTVLHVLKNTVLMNMYENQMFTCMDMDDYFLMLYKAINILPAETVIHRLTGDGPKSLLVAPLWTSDKKNVHNSMKKFFEKKGYVL